MPTVLRLDGLRVVVYPNDRRPAPVPVKGAEGQPVFVPDRPDGPSALRHAGQAVAARHDRRRAPPVVALLTGVDVVVPVRPVAGWVDAAPRGPSGVGIGPSEPGLLWRPITA